MIETSCTQPAPERARSPVRRWLPRLLGPLLFGVLIRTGDYRAVGRILVTVDLRVFAASIILGWVLLALKGLRWKLLLQRWGIVVPLVDAGLLYSLGGFVGAVTPGQSGDLLKAWYLRRAGHPLGPSIRASVLDRLIDLGSTAAVALVGLLGFGKGQAQSLAIIAGGLALGGLAVVLTRADSRSWRALLPKLLRYLPLRLRATFMATADPRFIWSSTREDAVVISLVSIAALGCTLLRLYLACLAVGVMLPILPFCAVVGITTLAGLFSIVGLGTRDVAMVVVLTSYAARGQVWTTAGTLLAPAQAPATALALATVFLAVHLTNVLAGCIATFRYPLADGLAALFQRDAP